MYCFKGVDYECADTSLHFSQSPFEKAETGILKYNFARHSNGGGGGGGSPLNVVPLRWLRVQLKRGVAAQLHFARYLLKMLLGAGTRSGAASEMCILQSEQENRNAFVNVKIPSRKLINHLLGMK